MDEHAQAHLAAAQILCVKGCLPMRAGGGPRRRRTGAVRRHGLHRVARVRLRAPACPVAPAIAIQASVRRVAPLREVWTRRRVRTMDGVPEESSLRRARHSRCRPVSTFNAIVNTHTSDCGAGLLVVLTRASCKVSMTRHTLDRTKAK